MQLASSLGPEDWVVQSMPDASPVKWHLAHTTWFFERFVLRSLGIEPVDPRFDYLFNSYYESVGSRHPRARRGMLTRPTSEEVIAYRRAVDGRLADLAEHADQRRLSEIAPALELGINHEEQHQELLLTDVKHLFSENPIAPVYRGGTAKQDATAPPFSFVPHEGGLVTIGHPGDSFSFDNERPPHQVFLQPFALATRLVTCGEYLDFIQDGGYQRADLWLSDGWSWVNGGGHRAPQYWDLDERTLFTLAGKRAIAEAEPVCHVSYYEADAFARWAGARLPREAEWETFARAALAADPDGARGTFAESEAFHPQVAGRQRVAQVLGDAWVWTSSAYDPYPGFAPLPGAIGEYNGKFMVSQIVLRGASCVTPRDHARVTYRNFFPPSAAWQFTGIRLAKESA